MKEDRMVVVTFKVTAEERRELEAYQAIVAPLSTEPWRVTLSSCVRDIVIDGCEARMAGMKKDPPRKRVKAYQEPMNASVPRLGQESESEELRWAEIVRLGSDV